MDITDGWALANFVVNLLFLVMVLPFLRGAPCWMQRVSVWCFAFAMVFYSIGFLLLAVENWLATYGLKLGAGLEHIGVLVWIWRMTSQKDKKHQEEPEWNPSQVSSRPS